MRVEVREKSRNRDVFQAGGTVRRAPNWLTVDPDGKRIEVRSLPSRAEMELPEMAEQLIVEYYSR